MFGRRPGRCRWEGSANAGKEEDRANAKDGRHGTKVRKREKKSEEGIKAEEDFKAETNLLGWTKDRSPEMTGGPECNESKHLGIIGARHCTMSI